MSDLFDIVVVGAGPTGATLAAALGRHGYRLALIESYDIHNHTAPSFDDRAIALSWGSTRILNQLGLWSLLNDTAEPITNIHVSDRGHFGLTRINANEECVPALGYVIAASELGHVLTHSLDELSANECSLFCPAEITFLRSGSDSVSLGIKQQQGVVQLRARLLIAADGAHSTVRRLLGIHSSQYDYRQNAVIANITPQINHHNTAYERFTADGPIAVLPMRAHRQTPRCGLIWTVPRRQADEVLQWDEQRFLSVLQRRFGYRLGYLQASGKRSSYPLSLVTSAARYAERVVFIGNAAQTLHPVAGQGFNLALRDTAALLDCLLYPEPALDPGEDVLLQRYTSMRKNDQRRVIRFTDSLVKLFSNDWPVLSPLRATALTVLDVMPPLRRALVHMSMGLQSALPRLQE